MLVADDAVRRASTGGAWRPVENPLRGAPLAEYRSNGQPGGVETRPMGVAFEHLTSTDRQAYDAAVDVFIGKPLRVAAAGLDSRAFETLQRGRFLATTPAGGGIPVTAPPSARPMISTDTMRQASTLQSNGTTLVGPRVQLAPIGTPDAPLPTSSGDPTPPLLPASPVPPIAPPRIAPISADPVGPRIPVPLPSPIAGETNTGGTSTAPAPGTVAVDTTSTTRGTVTAADMGLTTNAAPSGRGVVGIVATVAIVLLLVVMFGGDK